MTEVSPQERNDGSCRVQFPARAVQNEIAKAVGQVMHHFPETQHVWLR